MQGKIWSGASILDSQEKQMDSKWPQFQMGMIKKNNKPKTSTEWLAIIKVR